MKKFLVIYHANADAMSKMNNDKSPEEMREAMKPWMEWAEKCGDGLVDIGSPLAGGFKITKNDGEAGTRDVVGYSILQAEDMDGAKKMLEGHPHLGWDAGCDIEVHEAMPLPGA